jgi:hypothetical protein
LIGGKPQQGKKRTQAEINREKADEEAKKKRRLELEKEKQKAMEMPVFNNNDRVGMSCGSVESVFLLFPVCPCCVRRCRYFFSFVISPFLYSLFSFHLFYPFLSSHCLEFEVEPPVPVLPDENKENDHNALLDLSKGRLPRGGKRKVGAAEGRETVDGAPAWTKGTATSMQKDLNSQMTAAITSSNDRLPYTVS